MSATFAKSQSASIGQSALAYRLLDALPGLTSWLIITVPVWGSLVSPIIAASFALGYMLYSAYLAIRLATFALIGLYRVKRNDNIDWHSQYVQAALQPPALRTVILPWDSIFHIIIIPNYNERPEKLQATLEHLARQQVARDKLIVVLAMEAREPGAEDKARRLIAEFQDKFAQILYTIHPADLPGEIPGKSSNEGWAARMVYHRVVEEQGIPLEHLTVTSCDADSAFHPNYFAALTHHFAISPDRYLLFWQSPMLLYGNVWHVPALVRVNNAVGGLMYLAMLSDRRRPFFPWSTYSLSLHLAHTVGYWDPEIIPEDWHMFLKCFFAKQGLVRIEPIYLPTMADAPRPSSYLHTLISSYKQFRRHAWGASDISYAILQAAQHREIPLLRRFSRVFALTRHHIQWATTWFVLSLGLAGPIHLSPLFANSLLRYTLEQTSGFILSLSWILFLVIIFADWQLRPPLPNRSPWWIAISLFQWLLLPISGLVLATLPALDAQTRLMLGRPLVYQVTEK
ncbi:MAG: glycosyltransferase family 2 protein [Chloroflexi bacterium]|nr:glycosyltransferase family 2 protein [Chloroflexota bacterium]